MKSLITITSCNRIDEVKKYILPYIDFCNRNTDFDFLLALDGNNQEYIDFCCKFEIPLLYSDKQEGVGLSKNRVLTKFHNYDYYFFIDDDVELLNGKVFGDNIEFSKKNNIPHLSGLTFGEKSKEIMIDNQNVIYGFKAGGYFNFFDANYLKKVGGWHTCFAKYKRYGHSEHSYRFYINNFQKNPFICIESTIKNFILHNPPHVTSESKAPYFEHFHFEEEELIHKKISFFPIQTISKFYFIENNMSLNNAVIVFLDKNNKKYPLIKGIQRNICYSDFYFFKFYSSKNYIVKFFYLFLSFINNPINNQIKHLIKNFIK